jgi:predicted Zn finger-like uncharacterized protein
MLLNCNSCKKKFVVPNNAITKLGRLVQCGSCGNKWTQFPTEDTYEKKLDSKKLKFDKIRTTVKKPQSKKNLYTVEYLQKKHGITINKSNNTGSKSLPQTKKNKISLGFYSYIIILFVFLISLFGVLELTKGIIILKYPFLEMYINYLYEAFDIVKISILQFVY